MESQGSDIINDYSDKVGRIIQMVQQESVEFYTKLLQSGLPAGYDLLKSQFQSQQFVRDTVGLLMGSTLSQELRLQLLTLIRTPLRQSWEQASYSSIKDDLRGAMLQGVAEHFEHLKIVQAYALIVKDLLEFDGVTSWLEPLGELIKWMAVDEPKQMQAGVEFFLVVLQDASNSQMYKLAPAMLPNLFSMFAQSELTQSFRQKLLILVLLVIRTFSSFDGSQDSIVNECFSASYDIWMSLFLSALQSSLTIHLNMKRYILKSLTLIFRDMLRYSGKSLQNSLLPIWEFCYKVCPLYLWTTVFNMDLTALESKKSVRDKSKTTPRCLLDYKYLGDDGDENYENDVDALAHQVVQFLSTMLSIPALHNILKYSLYHLVNCLYHYLIISHFDLINWINNPQSFMPSSHSNEEAQTVRSKVLAIFNQLIEKFEDVALQAILMVSEKFLLDHPQKQTTSMITEIYEKLGIYSKLQFSLDKEKLNNLVRLSSVELGLRGETWRKVEAALAVLGRFSEDIIVFQSKVQSAFDIQSFVVGLMKHIQDPSYLQLLKGQALLCITRYTQIISIKHKQLFVPLLRTALIAVSSQNELPVRVIGCRAISMFSRKIEKHKMEVPQDLFRQISAAMQVTSIPPLPQIVNTMLEALIELSKLSKSQSRLMASNSVFLLNIFHEFSGSNSTLQHIFTLLGLLCSERERFQLINPIFGEFLENCITAYTKVVSSEQKAQLKPYDLQLMLAIMRLLTIFIEGGQQLNFRVVSTLPNLLLANEDNELQVQATICLKNFIRVASPTIIKNNFTPEILKVINKLIEIPKQKSFESASLYAGNLIILAFNNLLEGKADTSILERIVKKVFKSRTPSIIQSLVLVYSRIINNTGDQDILACDRAKLSQLVEFLASFSVQNRMGLKILVDKWLLQQSLFRGKHTKTATFMALTKLFLLKDKKIENLLVIGFNPSHTNINSDVCAPLKILSTLIPEIKVLLCQLCSLLLQHPIGFHQLLHLLLALQKELFSLLICLCQCFIKAGFHLQVLLPLFQLSLQVIGFLLPVFNEVYELLAQLWIVFRQSVDDVLHQFAVGLMLEVYFWRFNVLFHLQDSPLQFLVLLFQCFWLQSFDGSQVSFFCFGRFLQQLSYW